MKIYFAPLEGITGYVYRRVYHQCFTAADKYFLPFVIPHTKRPFNSKEKNDLLPEHNEGMYAVPQIMTKVSEDFLVLAEELRTMGYEEININAGCPSGTVVSKERGAGLLADPEKLYAFLDGIFSGTDMKISVKTRIGMNDPEEFRELLEVYDHFPLHELIIHPRVRTDYYKNTPNWDMYEYALEHSRNPVVYNGDLKDMSSVHAFKERFPGEETVMIGRGLITNPGLIGEIHGEGAVGKEKLLEFHDRLLQEYEKAMDGERNVLFKMKEIWVYMGEHFQGNEKYLKKIRKASRIVEYQTIVNELFQSL